MWSTRRWSQPSICLSWLQSTTSSPTWKNRRQKLTCSTMLQRVEWIHLTWCVQLILPVEKPGAGHCVSSMAFWTLSWIMHGLSGHRNHPQMTGMILRWQWPKTFADLGVSLAMRPDAKSCLVNSYPSWFPPSVWIRLLHRYQLQFQQLSQVLKVQLCQEE